MTARVWFATKLGVLCVLAFLCAPVWAQETTGGIQGTVKDPTGAVVPNAAVEISSPSLIEKRTSTSDAGGYFHLAQLPPGTYSVVITASGFAPQTLSNLDVKTGGLPTVNVTLQVSGVQQEVTVEATSVPEAIDVTLSKVQTVIPEEVVTAIPKSRSFQSLIPFAPGARQEPLTSARENRANGFQIDGATDSENVYMIDGVNTTNLMGGGVGKDFQSDFIQEVQVKSEGFRSGIRRRAWRCDQRGSQAWIECLARRAQRILPVCCIERD
jgi:Carboxypeptidase regulatory-like domain